jgi:hypothetical protein
LWEERSVAPNDLASVKLKTHQEVIARWATQVNLDFERAWQLREECIASLSKNAIDTAARKTLDRGLS